MADINPLISTNQPKSLTALSEALMKRAVQNNFSNIFAQLQRKGFYYHRKDIFLDGMTFEDCAFENCRFITETGNFSLRNCRIYGPETIFEYRGGARKIASLYELMNASILGKSAFPTLFPKMDQDGRITIE